MNALQAWAVVWLLAALWAACFVASVSFPLWAAS